MGRNFATFFSHRIIGTTGSRRSNIAMYISIAALSVAIVTILLTFTIVNGFRDAIKEKILELNPSIYVYNVYGNNEAFFNDKEAIKELLENNDRNMPVIESFRAGALLSSPQGFQDVVLVGDENDSQLKALKRYIVDGCDTITSNGIIISRNIAGKLNIEKGDKIDVTLPSNGNLRYRRLTVDGIFNSDIDDFDNHYAFVSLPFIVAAGKDSPAAMARLEIPLTNTGDDILLSTANRLQDIVTVAFLHNGLSSQYAVGNVIDDAASYWGWLAIMDVNIVVITSLMAFIALFTLMSSLTIIILDHVPTIGILKALGSSNNGIKQIFVVIGSRLVLWAVVISNIVGAAVIFSQEIWHWITLDPHTYYLDSAPMHFNWFLFLMTDAAVLAACFITLLIPVLLINRISPCEIIKFR